jgi:hypothetical protein
MGGIAQDREIHGLGAACAEVQARLAIAERALSDLTGADSSAEILSQSAAGTAAATSPHRRRASLLFPASPARGAPPSDAGSPSRRASTQSHRSVVSGASVARRTVARSRATQLCERLLELAKVSELLHLPDDGARLMADGKRARSMSTRSTVSMRP